MHCQIIYAAMSSRLAFRAVQNFELQMMLLKRPSFRGYLDVNCPFTFR